METSKHEIDPEKAGFEIDEHGRYGFVCFLRTQMPCPIEMQLAVVEEPDTNKHDVYDSDSDMSVCESDVDGADDNEWVTYCGFDDYE